VEQRCNLAARLCAEAKDGQILVSSRIAERSKRSPHSKISETSI
jgi:class 3 adenylate cyclase